MAAGASIPTIFIYFISEFKSNVELHRPKTNCLSGKGTEVCDNGSASKMKHAEFITTLKFLSASTTHKAAHTQISRNQTLQLKQK